MAFRLLVTGGRDYSDVDRLTLELDGWLDLHPDMTLVHGACPSGADYYADAWAKARSIPTERYPADWKRHGRGAGPKRNQVMADTKPDVALAFPGGAGTADCVRRLKAAGVSVYELV